MFETERDGAGREMTNRDRLRMMNEYDLLCAIQDWEFRSHGACILRTLEIIFGKGRESGYGVLDSECEVKKTGHIPNIESAWHDSCKRCIQRWLNNA